MSGNHRPLEEIDVELIEHIKASPCIYDTAHPDFRLVYKKDHQWGVVADSLGMSVDEARKRWTVLRDRFARELKQIHLNPKKQSYGKNEFCCRMDFLRGFIKKRRRKKIGDLKVDKNTANSFAFEIVEMHPQSMQDIEESQEGSTSESKYAYVQDQRNEVSQNPKMEQVHESDVYQEYVDDSYDRVMTNQDTSCTSSISNAIYNNNACMNSTMYQTTNSNNEESKPPAPPPDNATESEDLFSKVIANYLKNLSRRYKIKAKVEMMQILEKYIEIEEGETQT